MTILIIASLIDPASVNIADKLIKEYGFEESERTFSGRPVYKKNDLLLAYLDVDDIYAEDVDRIFKAEEVIFASRHQSESGEPTLTVHVPGNVLNRADFGGRPGSLGWAHPQRMKAALVALKQAKEEFDLTEYSVSLEVTHHGPTELTVPAMFVEIGSAESQWTYEKAGYVVAKAIWAGGTNPIDSRSCVGFGGGHYAGKHTELTLEEDVAVGHIFSKYALIEGFEPHLIEASFRKTYGGCKLAAIDWKGVRSDIRRRLIEFLTDLNIEIIRC